jgi:putative endonuclease
MHRYWVYIISNQRATAVYVGLTNNIYNRTLQHKEKINPNSFSAKNNLNKLVYYEEFGDVNLAIKREKQLKNWHREWKENLIKEKNPEWKDLFVDFTIEGF